MRLASLIRFIEDTRTLEGVSWNLVDWTPLTGEGLLYTLFVFADGKHQCDVYTIEERERGQIPKPIMKQIADARIQAGVDPDFMMDHPHNWWSIFRDARKRWVDRGYQEFLQA